VAGILDSKSRVLDFALTAEGRRQLAAGNLDFAKATVSDRASFYERDSEGATDATQRIYFETYVSNTDQVTLTTDDSGQLIPFGGKNLEFASLADVSQTSSANFSSLKVLISDDPSDLQATSFQIVGKDFIFYPTAADATRPAEAHIDEIESLLFDKRLSRKKNFQFLPPVNKDGSRLGFYADVRQQLTDDSVDALLAGSRGTKYQSFVTRFRETSPSNSLNLQVFQQNDGESGLIKLDLVDFGFAKFGDREGRVIFAGRIMNNSYDFPVFINILTLVLS
jgi:hypothetical protein